MESEPKTQTLLNQISPHVYWYPPDSYTDRPILGAVIGRDGTLAVEGGNSPAHVSLFLKELNRIKHPPIQYLALTHWHWDHVFGAATFNVPTIAQVETRQLITGMTEQDWSDEALDRRVQAGTECKSCRDMIKLELPDRSHLEIKIPEIGFDSYVELDLGGVTCQIAHVGGDHSSDSSIVYVPEDKILFLGDCLGSHIYSDPPYYTTRELFPLLDRLIQFDANFYLDAHSPEVISRQQMISDAVMLRTIGKVVDQNGLNRERILQTLRVKTGFLLGGDNIDIIDAFLAGLKQVE